MSSTDSHPDQQHITYVGKHEVTYDTDDLMVIRVHGNISVDDARGLALAERKIWANNVAVYLLVIVDKTVSIDSGLLGEIKSLYAGRPPHLSALVGASFTLQTVGSVINRALRMLGRPSSLRFFKDEADARAWFDEERARRAAPDA
ncbi:MAG: STAS/SEC14 domain-containing protein [Polyangiaceae bacterium]|nr:STAS/SEC14 domain-containing protein [Polyangiaceae bacterium]